MFRQDHRGFKRTSTNRCIVVKVSAAGNPCRCPQGRLRILGQPSLPRERPKSARLARSPGLRQRSLSWTDSGRSALPGERVFVPLCRHSSPPVAAVPSRVQSCRSASSRWT